MVKKIYSVRDAKGEVFNTPSFQLTHGEAERNFKRLVNDPQSMVSLYPEDFHLYYIGEYNEQEGVITPCNPPQHICGAVALKNQTHLAAVPLN